MRQKLVPGSAVGSDKRLKPVTILAVVNSAVDQNATDSMAETSDKSLMDKYLHMGTKSGGRTPATAPYWSWSSTSKGTTVGSNWYLCSKICMIWAAKTDGEYKDDQMTSSS